MKSLDKNKPKELDWHIKWDYLLNKKKWKNPDEVNKVLTKFVEDLFTQQRTELLEGILNLECLKEEEQDWEKIGYEEACSAESKNELRTEIKEEIKKL